MPPRRRDDWVKRMLSEWGSATERMLCSSGIGFPKSSPIAMLMEYGTSTFSGYRSGRVVQGIPIHLRRLDHIVSTLPDGQRRICELRYVLGLSCARIAGQVNTTAGSVRYQIGKIHRSIDSTWDRAPG